MSVVSRTGDVPVRARAEGAVGVPAGRADRRRRQVRMLDAGDLAFVDLSRPAHWTNGLLLGRPAAWPPGRPRRP